MPVPLPAADDTPSEPGEWSLEALRGELDRLDEALHELLIERSEVVMRLARLRLKSGVALRPGREAVILRQRIAQHHGQLPPATIVRIWRELLAGTTAMQGAFSIAVCEADSAGGYAALAREQYGSLTPIHAHRSAAQAIAELSAGSASIAVLPLPADSDPATAWWRTLAKDAPRVHVVARLPFWAPRPEGTPPLSAFVLSTAPPDPSGNDRSLLGLAFSPELSRARLVAALTQAGFTAGTVLIERDQAAGRAQALADVAGFVTEPDHRLARLEMLGERASVLGAYAVPEEGKSA